MLSSQLAEQVTLIEGAISFWNCCVSDLKGYDRHREVKKIQECLIPVLVHFEDSLIGHTQYEKYSHLKIMWASFECFLVIESLFIRQLFCVKKLKICSIFKKIIIPALDFWKYINPELTEILCCKPQTTLVIFLTRRKNSYIFFLLSSCGLLPDLSDSSQVHKTASIGSLAATCVKIFKITLVRRCLKSLG